MHFDYDSQSMLIKVFNCFLRVDFTKSRIREKYQFFEPERIRSVDSVLDWDEKSRMLVFADSVSSWYRKIVSDNNFKSLEVQSLPTREISPGSDDREEYLIVDGRQALIVVQEEGGEIEISERTPFLYNFNFRKILSLQRVLDEKADSNTRKNRNDLRVVNYDSGFAILQITKDPQGEESITTAKVINVGSIMSGGYVVDNYTSSWFRHFKTGCLRKADGSFQLDTVLSTKRRDVIYLVETELRGERLKSLGVQSLIFDNVLRDGSQSWVSTDFLLLYLPREKGDGEGLNRHFINDGRREDLQLLNYNLEVLGALELGSAGSTIHPPVCWERSLVTFERVNEKDALVKAWEISLDRKKKFQLKRSRILRDRTVRRAFLGERGICLLTTNIKVNSTKDEFNNRDDVEMPALIRDDLKVYTFEMDLEIGMVVDLGSIELSEIGTIEYITNKEVHLFKDDGSPSFSINWSECLERNPVVSKIEYQKE